MPTKTAGLRSMPNSSPKMAADFVEIAHRYQALGADIQALKDHLMNPAARPDVGVRILAAMLSAAVLEEWLVRMQITAISEDR